MATNQNLSTTETGGMTPVPTLDESLAQLEEALDLFVSKHSDGQLNEPRTIEEKPVIHPLATKPVIPEPVPAVAAPVQNESMEQAIRELKQKIATPQSEGSLPWTASEVVMRAPEDEQTLTKRRFPLFTDGQKKMMMLVVIVLAFFALIGYLVWQRQQSDELRLAMEKQENARLRSVPVPTDSVAAETTTSPAAEAVPTALPAGDQGLVDNIRQILVAYNPTAANTRYKIEAKDGVVTLSGEVQSQIEKEGVENVIKPLTGITKINNNLVVKGFTPGLGNNLPAGGPVMYPQVNSAEARRLEEALKRDLAEGAKRAEDERQRIEQQNAQLTAAQRNGEDAAKQEAARQEAARQESERLRRQQTAQLHNEEDAAFRKQAEERLKQREKEESDRRAEEQRKAEAEQSQKATTPRPETNVLRSGTVAWRGIVKGVDDIVIRGTTASVQHVSGETTKDAKGSFSAAIPNAPISMRLVAASGPSPIRILQQPSASNNFTTIVRVGDGSKADGKPHSFTLRWSSQ